MDNRWVDDLIDPKDKSHLKLELVDDPPSGEILKGKHGQYPIIDGIPRFVPAEFYQDMVAKSDKSQTSKSFGDKWREEGIRNWGGTPAELESLREQFLALLGLDEEAQLGEIFFDGSRALNAGCGIAWSESIFNINKKSIRYAVDISLSVEVAHEKTKDMDNVFVAQADLFNLPFKDDFFDVIFSNGVLHHTGDADRSFSRLCRHLKPGGLIGIYVYCIKPLLREMADQEIRKKTTELDYQECHQFSTQMAKLGKSLQRYQEPIEFEEDIPILGIKAGRYDLQRFIYDHMIKCYYNSELDDEVSTLVNQDWYHPKNASHHSKEEVSSWFEANSIEDARFIVPPGWEHAGFFVSGRKKI